MNTTTLRGVFPDPRPANRRNFIRENIQQVKQMQGLLQESGLLNARNPRSDKYRNVPPKVSSNTSGTNSNNKSKHQITRSLSQNSKMIQSPRQNSTFSNPVCLPPKFSLKAKGKLLKTESTRAEEKFMNRAMQTERTDDLTRLYETGVIKYPSPSVLSKRSPKKKSLGSGDRNSNDITNAVESLDLNDNKDYVKENITNIKRKTNKQGSVRDPSKLPPTYQKGVVPKYLQDRKEELLDKGYEPECPPGHVLLPDDERKETLRVLRQSYADRINELNSMPVRSDTLRMRKRKMEIEEELKKIDEGIKVFQRPKVFVKINA